MKKVKCASCGCVVDVENPTPGVSCPNCAHELIGKNAQICDVCFFCGKEISLHETEIFCPGCGKEYHADCWIDNDGCGVDGCEYQDCLAPMEIPTEAATNPATIPNVATTFAVQGLEEKPSENASDADYFVIKNAPMSPTQSKQNEDAIIEEKMRVLRRREEIPEQKKISWQDVMDWKNTPRDTKYDFDGPWMKDPYLLQKAKNYAIFLFGGLIGGGILGVSLIMLALMFKYIIFHTGISFYTMVFFLIIGIVGGMVAAVYFAYRTMATLIDN